jgi:hypothetical protein
MRKLSLLLGALAWAAPALASATETIDYAYDAQGRMTAAQHSGNVNDHLKSKYFFDDADNPTEVQVTGADPLAASAASKAGASKAGAAKSTPRKAPPVRR